VCTKLTVALSLLYPAETKINWWRKPWKCIKRTLPRATQLLLRTLIWEEIHKFAQQSEHFELEQAVRWCNFSAARSSDFGTDADRSLRTWNVPHPARRRPPRRGAVESDPSMYVIECVGRGKTDRCRRVVNIRRAANRWDFSRPPGNWRAPTPPSMRGRRFQTRRRCYRRPSATISAFTTARIGLSHIENDAIEARGPRSCGEGERLLRELTAGGSCELGIKRRRQRCTCFSGSAMPFPISRGWGASDLNFWDLPTYARPYRCTYSDQIRRGNASNPYSIQFTSERKR